MYQFSKILVQVQFWIARVLHLCLFIIIIILNLSYIFKINVTCSYAWNIKIIISSAIEEVGNDIYLW